MSCRGVLFALEQPDVDHLRALNDEGARIRYVQEVIEERDYDSPWAAETDKAWDAIHRCFDKGNLTVDGGEYPLNHVIFSGEQLVTSGEYYISLKTPEQVRDIAAKIDSITRDDLKARYRKINPEKYGMELTNQDEAYTWEYFASLASFYKHAASAGRWVIFTVDQ